MHLQAVLNLIAMLNLALLRTRPMQGQNKNINVAGSRSAFSVRAEFSDILFYIIIQANAHVHIYVPVKPQLVAGYTVNKYMLAIVYRYNRHTWASHKFLLY